MDFFFFGVLIPSFLHNNREANHETEQNRSRNSFDGANLLEQSTGWSSFSFDVHSTTLVLMKNHFPFHLHLFKTLSKVFLKPLEESGLVEDSNEIKSLLGGIKVIVGYNSILLTDLQQRVPSWTVHSKLGDVFLRLVAFLKVRKFFPILLLLVVVVLYVVLLFSVISSSQTKRENTLPGIYTICEYLQTIHRRIGKETKNKTVRRLGSGSYRSHTLNPSFSSLFSLFSFLKV